MPDPRAARERLAAILSADVVGYSRLMRNDERQALALLDEYRDVFRDAITQHGGRVVDMAGDSVLAVFETANGAVAAAVEAQAAVAERNQARGAGPTMSFRTGVNLGDILEKPDGSIYGDGVNVAARVQADALSGGLDISGAVFRSVRARFGDEFVSRGEQQFKNIADPVSVYRHTGLGEADVEPPTPIAVEAPPRAIERPRVCVMPIKLISGGDEVAALAAGLHNGVMHVLGRQTAIETKECLTGDTAGEFRLEGSVQAASNKVRLHFTLFDTAAGTQVWAERYDRALDDVFELEDEIAVNVSSTVRLQIKARQFERLRNTPDDALSVADLLSKAAGYFVTNYRYTPESRHSIEKALEQDPENSMAWSMLVTARYREYECRPEVVPAEVSQAMSEEIDRALSFNPSGDYAHLVAAVIRYDVFGDFERALVHAEASVNQNPGFSIAVATLAIVKAHLESTDAAIPILERAMAAAADDPHRFRHQRELALIHFMRGEPARGAAMMERVRHQAPGMHRNDAVLAALQWAAGDEDRARAGMRDLLEHYPDLTRRTVRPARFSDSQWQARYDDALAAAGLPP